MLVECDEQVDALLKLRLMGEKRKTTVVVG